MNLKILFIFNYKIRELLFGYNESNINEYSPREYVVENLSQEALSKLWNETINKYEYEYK